MVNLFLFGLLQFSAFVFLAEAGYKTVCYYESWAVYRRLDSRLSADFSLNTPPCTHLIYAFALVKDGLIASFDPTVDLDGAGQYGGYQKFNQINKSAKNIKTLLAVGGWTAGSKEYSDMASTSDSREMFAQQALIFLRQHGFQGLDIDWEYPADRDGSRPEDKENLSSLLQELRSVFNAEQLQPGQERLLLTIAVSPHPDKLDKSYEMAVIGKLVDFINIMTYDYARASWISEIKPHNPLWKRSDDTSWNSQLNADWAVQKMIKDGVPSEKLILGIPTYGVTFKVSDDGSVPRVHGSHLGSGDAGPVTKEKGYLAFYEICRRLKMEKQWISAMDDSGVPVCYRKNVWISYENPKSTRTKALYVMRSKLGGAMVWSLATDDFNGFCYGKRYPITQTIRDTFDASTKLMSRTGSSLYNAGSNNAAALSTVSENCLSDGSRCTTPVFCPEIKRVFLPYELACVNVLGKCSYPKIQICDVPKVTTTVANYNKVSIMLTDIQKSVNLSCANGASLNQDLVVTSVPGKCKKRYLTCEGNLLGGYNVVTYFCPGIAEFDSTLKVCKLPDTYDGEEENCVEQRAGSPNRLPAGNGYGGISQLADNTYGYSFAKTRSGSYAAFSATTQKPEQQKSFGAPEVSKSRPVSSLYSSSFIEDDIRAGYEDVTIQPTSEYVPPTEEPVFYGTTQRYEDQERVDPAFEDIFRQSAGFPAETFLEGDEVRTGNNIELPPSRSMTQENMNSPQKQPEFSQSRRRPQFAESNQRFTEERNLDQAYSGNSQIPEVIQPPLPMISAPVQILPARKTPPQPPVRSQAEPIPIHMAARKKASLTDGLVRKMRDQVSVPHPSMNENNNQLTRNFCGRIGQRTENPEKPCSSSFLLCLSPMSVIELHCGEPDENQQEANKWQKRTNAIQLVDLHKMTA